MLDKIVTLFLLANYNYVASSHLGSQDSFFAEDENSFRSVDFEHEEQRLLQEYTASHRLETLVFMHGVESAHKEICKQMLLAVIDQDTKKHMVMTARSRNKKIYCISKESENSIVIIIQDCYDSLDQWNQAVLATPALHYDSIKIWLTFLREYQKKDIFFECRQRVLKELFKFNSNPVQHLPQDQS